MKAPTIALLSFCAGLAAGALAMGYFRTSGDATGPIAGTSADTDLPMSRGVAGGSAKESNAGSERRLKAELDQLRRENQTLAAQLSVFQEAQTQAAESRDQRRENTARMRSFFTRRMEAQQHARIAHDREFFNLTPFQEEQLNAWAREQGELIQSRQALMQRVRDGQLSREEAQGQIGLLEAASVTYEEALRSVLTGEQLADFEDYEAQLDHNRREARAYEQLGELARSLVLSEEQKDALMEVFYLQEPPSGLRSLPREERRQAWRQYQEAELQQLQGILTPEQLELYQTRWRRGRD